MLIASSKAVVVLLLILINENTQSSVYSSIFFQNTRESLDFQEEFSDL